MVRRGAAALARGLIVWQALARHEPALARVTLTKLIPRDSRLFDEAFQKDAAIVCYRWLNEAVDASLDKQQCTEPQTSGSGPSI
jgi:hypothetical protein